MHWPVNGGTFFGSHGDKFWNVAYTCTLNSTGETPDPMDLYFSHFSLVLTYICRSLWPTFSEIWIKFISFVNKMVNMTHIYLHTKYWVTATHFLWNICQNMLPGEPPGPNGPIFGSPGHRPQVNYSRQHVSGVRCCRPLLTCMARSCCNWWISPIYGSYHPYG